ncbi:MAG: hypothetical protein ACE5JB_12075, partial [bacterium]
TPSSAITDTLCSCQNITTMGRSKEVVRAIASNLYVRRRGMSGLGYRRHPFLLRFLYKLYCQKTLYILRQVRKL